MSLLWLALVSRLLVGRDVSGWVLHGRKSRVGDGGVEIDAGHRPAVGLHVISLTPARDEALPPGVPRDYSDGLPSPQLLRSSPGAEGNTWGR